MQKNNRLHLLILTFLGPILLFTAWPPHSFSPLLFLSFVPLLILEKKLTEKRFTGIFFGYLYLSLFLFNLSTTWWVWNASAGGAVFMLLANTLLMTLPFMAYRFTNQVLDESKALMTFILFWLSFEYVHFQWDLSYPWLTLGNGFAHTPNLIQWYEYTGVLGGTLWVLVINILIYRLFNNPSKLRIIWPVVLLLLPLIWSFFLGTQQNTCKKPKHEIVVVQPNIDPYEKFETDEITQVRRFIELAENKVTDNSELVILPETAVVQYMDESYLNSFESINLLTNFIRKHPNIQILTGASTYRFFGEKEEKSSTARLHPISGRYYDSYNTALLIDSTGAIDIYHKSKLVPGTEKMPYPGFFKILGPLAIDLGGISGSLGIDTSSRVFRPVSEKFNLDHAPLVCYESIYGEYVSSFVRKGAEILFIITNDGWWGNTPGYRQHLDYARLRAIENRRYVVRSANTGISCVIDDNGKVLETTNWWEATAFKTDVKQLNYMTFYATHGDYIGRIAGFLSIFLILSVWVKRRIKK